ncbi:GNAT family N-acetyltransferase [Amylibacter kogurei]|uniref:GNAT family N-acetyltransferase n=1 Tax=Paramylibacter kogurei TaxID=1889778 RepID=A0A2G5K1F8_9RHOB|nr:GNAT family N-acetyltransferase [Amylibacter kogurei]PIB22853.1 GNAT family N-acetyltransferase [Amylibacter kogurei]
MISIETGDPHHPQATALLRASHALMESLFPAESNHYLSIDALCVPDIRFMVAKNNDQIVGCGAIANKGDYGEIKSMFVSESARGLGVAKMLMDALEKQAQQQGLSIMRLETGNLLHAAHRLYESCGYTYIGPFGDYPDDPNSLFMQKVLSTDDA